MTCYNFEASIDDSRILFKVLHSIATCEFALMEISDMGIKVSVEKAKCSQLTCFLQKDLFNDFQIGDEEILIRITPKPLIDFISIFGSDLDSNDAITDFNSASATSLKLKYYGEKSSFHLLVGQNSLETELVLSTYEKEEICRFEMLDDDVVSKIILDSKVMKEIWSDFDTAASEIEITFSEQNPCLHFSTRSHYASIDYEFNNRMDAIHSVFVERTIKGTYQMNSIKLSLKALMQSSQVSIRINEVGLLSLQFMIRLNEEDTAYTEFFCLPLVDKGL